MGKERKLAFPLHPVIVQNPFEQWGLDVVGEINPNSSKLHKYILTTTDYFFEWTEAIPLKVINHNEIIQFLQWNIVTRFGVPNYLVFDNAKYFSSLKIVQVTLGFHPIFSYAKSRILGWDKGGSLLGCLISLYFKSYLNPFRKSKVIDPPVQGTKFGY